MKKLRYLFLSILLLFNTTNLYATQITYSKTFVDGEVLTANDLETMKTDISSVVNAGGGPVGLTNTQTVSGNKTLSGTTTMSGILTLSGVISGESWAILEGATADDFEVTLKVTDPTIDNEITFPAATGNLVVFENANTQDVNLIWEGATQDDFETTFTIVDPTADREITFPDESVTVGKTKSKVIYQSRDISLTTDLVITGVGFTPASILCFWALDASEFLGLGNSDSDKGGVGITTGTGAAIPQTPGNDVSTFIFFSTDTNNFNKGVVSTYDSDGVTITWTKTSTPTGTVDMYFLFIR